MAMEVTPEQLRDGLRAWARGSSTTEAAVELLIRHRRAVHVRAPWLISTEEGSWSIDVDALRWHAGAWSGGEQRVVRIACSLLGGEPVRLDDDISALGRPEMDLVLAALSHAAGADQSVDIRLDHDGHPHLHVLDLGPLHPWPEQIEGRS